MSAPRRIAKSWPSRWLACAALVGLALAGPAPAADKDSGQREMVRGLQQRLRTAEQDKARLAQEKTEADAQLKDAQDKLATARRSTDTERRQRTALLKDLEDSEAAKALQAEKLLALEARLADTEARRAETQAALVATTERAERGEAEGRRLAGELAQRNTALAEAVARNDSLYKLGAVMIGQSQAQVAQGLADPLSLPSRLAVENKAEELREQIDQAWLPANRLAQREQAQRQRALAQRETAEQATREAVQREQAEQLAQRQARIREQTSLDRWARRARTFFQDIEW